jgi:hypothetical protein
MNEVRAILRTQEGWGFILKFMFCSVFFLGISRELGIGMGATPIIVLGSLVAYWKFVRHRFIP